MLRECPLYPWASSCFPGMLVQLKEQDHSKPMTFGDWEELSQAHPWEAPDFWRFEPWWLAGRAPTGSHLVTHTLCHLSWVSLFHQHHPSIHVFLFTRCPSHAAIHFLPLSMQATAICSSIYWTLSDRACVGRHCPGRAQPDSGF